ncbi:MAG: peptidase [Saprospiraceae bacterium]|nr:peptidase [Saprospiraceae bacterium]MCB9318094.1 peptidase [Lewinellaceae bacterium]
MTYCLGIKLKAGIVGMADTRITSGNETSTAEKYKVFQHDERKLFIMTSGLRSVRDKSLTYFSEILDEKVDEFSKLYQAVNAFGEQVKRVAQEDKTALSESGLQFNIHTIVGGQFPHDDEHKLYLLYPEGNWIEIAKGYPFTIIGNSGYGTPVLRRTLRYDSSIKYALKTGFLSFDSTRVSANDVGYPLDVLIYPKNGNEIKVRRFEEEDLRSISNFWGQKLTEAVHEVPDDWINGLG